jgi:hypothetical protein
MRLPAWNQRPRAGSLMKWLLVVAAMLARAGVSPLVGADDERIRTRSIPVEVYLDSEVAATVDAAGGLRARLEKRQGVIVTEFDLREARNRNRFEQICRAFRVEQPGLPLVYACQQIVSYNPQLEASDAAVDSMYRMTVFVREGCPRCADAKLFLPTLRKKYPGLDVRIRDLVTERAAVDRLNQLTEHYRTAAASVPVFHFCNQLVVGYDSDETTGKRLDRILEKWTVESPEKDRRKVTSAGLSWPPHVQTAVWGQEAGSVMPAVLLPFVLGFQSDAAQTDRAASASPDEGGLPQDLLPLPVGREPEDGEELPISPLPLPVSEDGLPLPGAESELPVTIDGEGTVDRIDLPVFGELSARTIGLPLFTIAVGLVDGFNPCAMWVLLFLLSVLVNLHDRWKILAVAGTFVLISGAAYFAFMAAWLNVFLLVGLLRWVQVTLGLLAVGVGSIHIKDFFAFKQGLSLSIPERAKPGLYARVRRIVTAESLTGAVAGAAVLAVLVNVIELLCTAGLPALYTEILTLHNLSTWQNYSYLLLYNVAYMFDDSVMVGLVVVTLGRRKMQETHGRWLKLLSGSVIATLGLVMIFRPEWLG